MTFLVVRVTLEGNVDLDGVSPAGAPAGSRRFGSLARVSSDERTVRDSTSTTTCLGRPARSTDPRRFTSPALPPLSHA